MPQNLHWVHAMQDPYSAEVFNGLFLIDAMAARTSIYNHLHDYLVCVLSPSSHTVQT
jgi:hypothetical protein